MGTVAAAGYKLLIFFFHGNINNPVDTVVETTFWLRTVFTFRAGDAWREMFRR